MNKVCIGQADSSLKSEQFGKDNYYYEENQFAYPTITKFGKALIDDALTLTEKSRWGLSHALDDYWVRRQEYVEEWIIYDIFVNLSDKDYTFWKLKYG